VSQQQRPDNVSIDDIPIDIDNTQSAEVDPADIPTKSSPSLVGSPVSSRRRIRWACWKRPGGGISMERVGWTPPSSAPSNGRVT